MVKGEVAEDIYDSYYSITKTGKVYSYHNEDGFEISKSVDRDGYPVVALHKDGDKQTCTVHRLLALTFIPNPENKEQVNHKNGIKLDYSLSNLEWTTPSENMKHAYSMGLCKLPNNNKPVIDTSTGKIYPSAKEAAADLNIHYSSCKKYLLGMVKKHTNLKYLPA